MRAWGFEPTAMGFVWVKLNPKAPSMWLTERDLFFGPGLTTRKNAEYVVLGRRGHPERLAKDVFEIILSARREHSRKPDEAYRRIERYCAGPRLDLFACERRDGWIPYGDEVAKFDATVLDDLLVKQFSDVARLTREASCGRDDEDQLDRQHVQSVDRLHQRLAGL
jgi:N6-adenosine-specific RNA methylase IME4